MSTSFFFLHVEKDDLNSTLLGSIEDFAVKEMIQVYVLNKPLGDTKYNYDYTQALVLLSPGQKICFLDIGNNDEKFEIFVEDFVEDLAYISDKYRYKEKIGRPREWKRKLIHKEKSNSQPIPSIFKKTKIDDTKDQRIVELLISLLTGSINDIEKINIESADNLLDKVKQKIVLFDGDQTRFIYEKLNKKTIRIQGLSGTGKTELLLHKLKEIYINDGSNNSKIIFTCHNRILASSLKNRIPIFFNFMKVEQQIEWNERLWCVNAWGSKHDKNSGAYSYICDFYGIQFHRFHYGTSFSYVCKQALKSIKDGGLVKENGFAFDYVLLDESQDFPEDFISLCEIVTKKHVFVAGDIFQSIFDDMTSGVKPDYLLSKCYRTDPITLMFSHALGLGLFEDKKMKWLKDSEWEACGYKVKKENNLYNFTREPLRRFKELFEKNHKSMEIVETSVELNETSEIKILETIQKIKDDHPTVSMNDIAVIFIDNQDYVYKTADNLSYSIKINFGWTVNKAYESKVPIKDTLFVSNKNNVKGLEFPFVICVTKKIGGSISYRNALYMMLTRSFIKSYLLTSKDSNSDFIEELKSQLKTINDTGIFTVEKPSDDEIEAMEATIIASKETKKPFYDFVHDILNKKGVPKKMQLQFYNIIKTTTNGEDFDEKKINSIIDFNLKILDEEK